MINVKSSKTKAVETPAAAYAAKPEKKETKIYAASAILFAPLILYLAKLFGKETDEITASVTEEDEVVAGPKTLPLIQGKADNFAGNQVEDTDFGFAPMPDTITFGPLLSFPMMPIFRPSVFVTGQANDNGDPGLKSNSGKEPPSIQAVASSEVISPLSAKLSDLPSSKPNGADDGDEATVSDSDPEEEATDSDPDVTEKNDDDKKPGNRSPVVSGPVYLPDTISCAAVVFSLKELLRNASDVDGDALGIKDISTTSGTIAMHGDSWTFLGDNTGPVTLTYTVSDGELAVAQTAHFDVLNALPMIGSSGDDLMIGTICGDEILGADGDDNIDSRAGNDIVAGGPGDDHIIAGAGDDVVRGGYGNDIIIGGSGNDQLSGGAGDDRIYGGSGDDIIFGGSGNDFLDAGDGHDVVDAGSGNDVVIGGGGDDVIRDGSNSDEIRGGAGDDFVIAALDNDDDVYNGGDGHDAIDYSLAEKAIHIDLVKGTAQGDEIGHDQIENFELLKTGAGDDTIVFGEEAVTVVGGDGFNTFDFSKMSLPNTEVVPTKHVIADFKVGDRIQNSTEDYYEDVFERIEDEFERVYDSKIELERIPIRYSHENFEDIIRGRIEVDVHGNGEYELVILVAHQQTTLFLDTA